MCGNQNQRQLNFKLVQFQINKGYHINSNMHRHLQQSPPSQLVPLTSIGLPSQCQLMFKQLNCPATKICQLISGVKLAKAINHILYSGSNSVLSSSIITEHEDRKGNNVINMNMVLKQVKNNPKIKCSDQIEQLTTFKLIDSEESMYMFVKWIYQAYTRLSPKLSINKLKDGKPKNKQNINFQLKIGKHLQEQSKVIKIIEHYQQDEYQMQNHENQNEEQYTNYQMNNHKSPSKNQNIFQNVFFCDQISPQRVNIDANDSLDQSQKVSKKGSFKVVRPKSNFDDKKPQNNLNNSSSQDLGSPQKIYQKSNKNEKEGMKINKDSFNRYYSQQKQGSNRKTIPKMPDRPPIYRKLIKQQTKSQTYTKSNQILQNFKQPSPFNMEILTHNQFPHQQKNKDYSNSQNQSKFKNSKLFADIKNLEQKIQKQHQNKKALNNESLSLSNHKNTQFENKQNKQELKSRSKSTRKIFKLDIEEVSETERKSIIEWLISINLLNSMATTYYHRFHQICKNGVIFPQIINHHKGRSGDLCYFKNPIKPAEVHSNYQKVFTYLKDLPNFQNQLLFMYQYFVPEALENSFWSLLKSCQICFQKKNYENKNKSFTRDSSIKQRLKTKSETQTQKNQTNVNSLKKSLKSKTLALTTTPALISEGDYQKIKYGSTQKFKQTKKLVQTKIEVPLQQNSNKKQQQSKRKSSLDFIKQLPQKLTKIKPQELVQIEEPFEAKNFKGYRELHEMKKSHNNSSFINTPQKKKQNSLNGSRIVTTNSVKKLPQRPQQPSISLQMQMKSLKYLKQKGYLNINALDSLPLFQDPIRNGTLMNKIIIDELKTSYKYIFKPKNIVDCRQNFKRGFSQLKQSFILYPSSYQTYYQEIIKGEINLFYGIIFHILNANFNKHALNASQYPAALKNQSAILSITKNYNQFHQRSLQQSATEQVLFWIRELEQESQPIASMQIRDFNTLLSSILCKNLLFLIAVVILPQKYTLKPTYQQPINQVQQESNIKKILSFFTHSKLLKSEMAWKAKSVVKKQKTVIVQIMKQLMNYYKSKKKSLINMKIQHENPVISFVKFAKQNSREQIKGNERNNERLETTMANNSFTGPNRKQSLNKKKQTILVQIPWMRQLGFTQDLSLNNGVILCRLISKLTMQSINYNQNPTSKAQCLTNIRKALKLLDKFKWDEDDISGADQRMTQEIYKFIKEKYKHCYALKNIC